jgi:transposase
MPFNFIKRPPDKANHITSINRDVFRISLSNKICSNSDKLWIPPIYGFLPVANDSCFDFNILENPDLPYDDIVLNDVKTKFDKNITKCDRIFLILSYRQTEIINLWFDACTDMYNHTVQHIKSIINFNKLRVLRKLNKVISKKGDLMSQIDDLKKFIKQCSTEKIKHLKYIQIGRSKTKTNIRMFNVKISKITILKHKIKDYNKKLNILKNKLCKCSRIYKDLYDDINKKVNYKYLRTYVLKDIRNTIAQKYVLNKKQNTSIKIHILDCMIKMACASFKSSITNYIEGNSGMFKIRYWSKNRNKKVMEIEPSFIKNGNICNKVFGDIIMKRCTSSNKWVNYKLDIKKAIKLHYDSKTGIYSLFVPRLEETIASLAETDSFVGIDPGVRTFMSCISADKAFQFGTDIYCKIYKILTKIDNINSEDITQDDKNKKTRRHYKKITNMVDDMHWKIISYLTDNYEKIYIGKLNMKDVVSNETSNISAMTKRVGLMMRHYQFRQRLVFKCRSKRINCIEVDERYTSKTCSKCGNYKKDLGSNKIYNCDKCGIKMERDINASRCILLKNAK